MKKSTFVTAFCLFLFTSSCAFAFSVDDLRTQMLTTDVVVDANPSLSWKISATRRGTMQQSYHIILSTDKEGRQIVWDSGVVNSDHSTFIPTTDASLKPSTTYFWRVDVTDNYGNRATSKPATFSTGLMQTGWSGAQWIQVSDSADNSTGEAGVPIFRKPFVLKGKDVVSALLYTSALGIYDLYVNGQRAGHIQADGSTRYDELKPGWTEYPKQVFYTVHNVTSLLRDGSNNLDALVAPGWWMGKIESKYTDRHHLGFLAKMVITYKDDSQNVIVTDTSWTCTCDGPMRSSDIYDGEVFDARRITMLSAGKHKAAQWNAVTENHDFSGSIDIFQGPPVRVLNDLLLPVKSATVYEGVKKTGTDYGAIKVLNTRRGPGRIKLSKGQGVIFDFGQNFAGWVDFKVKGKAGTSLRLRFAEMINDTGNKKRGNDGPAGSLYRTNLRSAKAELTYILSGNESGESYHPITTFYGFRYCEILPTEDVEICSVEGLPISSSHDQCGGISTDNALVNKLISNIAWGQRSNFISIPSDCPQRNERLGWTADTQIFSRTAMYNANLQAFYHKWMTDMRLSQRADGAYPDVAPKCWTPYGKFGNGGWADAGIVVPWNVYLMYGDKSILEENFDSMERYMSWVSSQIGNGYKYTGAGTAYGDWLSFAVTDSRYVSVAYCAYDALLMSKMAHALSVDSMDIYAQKAIKYDSLFKDIRQEFYNCYFKNGPSVYTQTACLLALNFDLLPADKDKSYITQCLKGMITNNHETLNTGFIGTGVLNCTLSKVGLSDKAYNLLLQRRCPSWLYSVDQGATTMWERWNSYTLDKGFGDAGMNSFNHYAYGAVEEWLYRYVAGIAFDEQNPGFKHIILQPTPDLRDTIPGGQSRILSADGSYNSIYGTIVSSWKYDVNSNVLRYTVTVPANTTATLYLPASSDRSVNEGRVNAKLAEGVSFVKYDNSKAVFSLGSGTYHFTTQPISRSVKANLKGIVSKIH